MESSSRISLPENASLALAPPIIGVALNWWLYGIFIMQYFVYLNNAGTRDGKYLRAVVHFLFVLDTVQTFMIMDDVFFWFVYNFGDFPKLFEFNLAAIDGPLLDAIITFTVQLVYCWRLWKIGRWKVLPIVTAVLALVACVGGLIVGIHSILDPTHIRPAVYLWLFASAVTDIVIATSMTYMLLQYRTAEASKTTMAVVKRVLLLTLETNAATAAVAVALVTAFLIPSITPPKTNIYVVFGYILGKMYSNCFMVLLNQRIYYDTAGRANEEISTIGSSSHQGRGTVSHNPGSSLSSQCHNRGQVSVIRFAEVRVDEPSDIELGLIHGTRDSQHRASGSSSFKRPEQLEP